jgi:hypothetical protein
MLRERHSTTPHDGVLAHFIDDKVAGMAQITRIIEAGNSNTCATFGEYAYLAAWSEQLWCPGLHESVLPSLHDRYK